MIKKTYRHDNRGLTLVELLVAVVILGIIVSPLLHSFVTSARTAQKSRQYGDATTAAQNILETIEAADLDALLENATVLGSGAAFYQPDEDGGYSPSAGPYKDGDGKYYIAIPVSSGSSGFDALVTLDTHNPLNEKPVTKYTELIATSQATGADNPDIRAKADFDTALALLEGSSPSLARRIRITVEAGEAVGEAIRYPISIDYDYTGGFFYNSGADYYSFSETYPFETYYTSPPGAADPEASAFSMFFFFDTYYGQYGSSQDTIYIYNNNNPRTVGSNSYDLRFNLFLVRQKTADPASLGALEASYSARIRQFETYGFGKDEANNYLNACKVYTNMNTNLSTGGDIPAFEYNVSRGSIWYYPGTEEPRLVVSDIIDRLVNINVRLYAPGEAGSGFTGTALASMDATKLD